MIESTARPLAQFTIHEPLDDVTVKLITCNGDGCLTTSASCAETRQAGTRMTTTTTITNVCQIAEDYGREIGLRYPRTEQTVSCRSC